MEKLSNDYLKHIADMRKAESVESADVIKAAMLVKRWCIEHIDEHGWCECPFAPQEDADGFACACSKGEPHLWRDVKND